MLIKSKKASSFFLFDAVIAAAIFFMTISIVMYSLNTNPEIETPRVYGENLMNFFLVTQVQNINNEDVSDLILQNNITDPSRTLFEQMLIFHYENNTNLNSNFTKAVSESKIPPQFGFNVSISNSTSTESIYSHKTTNREKSTLIKIRRIAITKLDNGNIYGPFVVSVDVWY